MRPALRVAAVLLCVIGVIWIGQGFGYLPGSFMTGQREWAVYGALTFAVGLLLAWFARRGPRA